MDSYNRGVAAASNVTPTTKMAEALQRAFDFYNERLFYGELHDVVLTVVGRHKDGTRGYFSPGYFRGRIGRRAEISINPERPDPLSTLVHEMVHHQHHLQVGESSARGGGHGKGWGVLMKAVGLHPSHTGEPGGRETGKQMSHYVIPGGRFEVATAELKATGWRLPYRADPTLNERVSRQKLTFTLTCPECDQKVRATLKEGPGIFVICGHCDEQMMPVA